MKLVKNKYYGGHLPTIISLMIIYNTIDSSYLKHKNNIKEVQMLFKVLFFDSKRDTDKEYEGLIIQTVAVECDDKDEALLEFYDEALLEFYRTLAMGTISKVVVLDVLRMEEYDRLEPYQITVTGRSNEAEIYFTRTFKLPAINKTHAELMAYKLECLSELVGVTVTEVVRVV